MVAGHWCWNMPGHYHLSHGDVKFSVTGCQKSRQLNIYLSSSQSTCFVWASVSKYYLMFLLKINFYTFMQNFKTPSVVAVGIVSGCTFDCLRAIYNVSHFLYVAHGSRKGGRGGQREFLRWERGESGPLMSSVLVPNLCEVQVRNCYFS